MRKLKGMIEAIINEGKFPSGFRLYMVDILINVYNKLLNGECAEFIDSEVKTMLDRCGIKTKEKGIGWIAYK